MYGRFEDLKIWQMARKFRKNIYGTAKKFPKFEQFGLASQIRNAAISITANIAEGHGRYHYKEEMQFMRIARGSLNEVLDHLYTAIDEEYITQKSFDSLYGGGRELEKAINGYIGYLQKKKD